VLVAARYNKCKRALEMFPWDDVDAARNDAGLQAEHDSEGAHRHYGSRVTCPKCSRSEDELVWFYFRSPEWTWKNLCGRAGWLAVCDPCRTQAAFFIEIMN
jgi:hypothetical protein